MESPRAFPRFVGVRLTETEFALLRRLTEREGTTISGMVRECIVRESVRPLFTKTAAEGQNNGA